VAVLDLPELAERRLRALLILAWEDNRLLAMRLLSYSEQVCVLKRVHAAVAGMQLQVLAAFARTRARDLLERLRAMGVKLTVRLPAEVLHTSSAEAYQRARAMGRRYRELGDLAANVARDAALVQLLTQHVEELKSLVGDLAAIEEWRALKAPAES
jgi:hypothetical protein